MHLSEEGKRIIRFLIVGLGNTLFGYSIYATFILLVTSYSIAILLATIVGVVFNFFTIGSIVFKSFDWSKIYLFVMVYCGSYGINVFCLYLLIGYGVNSLVAGAISLPLVAAVTYIGLKFLVFSKQ